MRADKLEYRIEQIVTFNSLLGCNFHPIEMPALVMERMKFKLNSEGAALKDTKIRPFPCDVGESARAGYDRLAPRWGLQIILTGE